MSLCAPSFISILLLFPYFLLLLHHHHFLFLLHHHYLLVLVLLLLSILHTLLPLPSTTLIILTSLLSSFFFLTSCFLTIRSSCAHASCVLISSFLLPHDSLTTDFRNDYKTLYPWFMESVWWVFAQLYQKGLVYRGFKVMPFSTACSTPLSNFEAGQNYKDTQDPSGRYYLILVCRDYERKEKSTFTILIILSDCKHV